MKIVPLCLGVVATIIFSLGASSCFAQGLLEISSYAWTDFVNKENKQYRATYTSPAQTKGLYLWVEIKGSKELLDRLRSASGGLLPIRYQWYRYEGDRLSSDPFDTINLSVGKTKDLQSLSYQVDALGYFTWRVWSGDTPFSKGKWKVEIVYDDDQPILCSSAQGPKQCDFIILVR